MGEGGRDGAAGTRRVRAGVSETEQQGRGVGEQASTQVHTDTTVCVQVRARALAPWCVRRVVAGDETQWAECYA